MKKLVFFVFVFVFVFVFGQSFQALPNNVFRISTVHGSSIYEWDRGQQKFSLDGIGEMYFDRFTHNDSVRFSSNFDLYHNGSAYIDKVFLNGYSDTLNLSSTVEDWMHQFNSDYNYNLPVFGPQNIDTTNSIYPNGMFFEKRNKEVVKQLIKIDYGFSDEVTFSVNVPLIDSYSINQSIFDVSVTDIQGFQILVDYHQNSKFVLKNFIESDAFYNLPGDSLEQILEYIYKLYYSNSGQYSVNWAFHAQDDPINNLLVDHRFIPNDMKDSTYVSIEELTSYYYPKQKSGNGIGDIDIGLNILLRGDPAWSSDKSTEAIYGQIFVSVPFGKTLSSFSEFFEEDSTRKQLSEIIFGKGTYRWTLGVQGIRLLKGEKMARVYYQGQYKFSLATTLNTPIRLFSGGHTHSDSILHSVGNTYKYDMGNGLFIRAGGEYEFVKNRIRFLGQLSSQYKGMDNYLSKSPRWDKWMEEYTGIKSHLDFKFELWFINSISSNRIGPFSFNTYAGYKETLIANNTYGGKQFYIGFSTFYQGW